MEARLYSRLYPDEPRLHTWLSHYSDGFYQLLYAELVTFNDFHTFEFRGETGESQWYEGGTPQVEECSYPLQGGFVPVVVFKHESLYGVCVVTTPYTGQLRMFYTEDEALAAAKVLVASAPLTFEKVRECGFQDESDVCHTGVDDY